MAERIQGLYAGEKRIDPQRSFLRRLFWLKLSLLSLFAVVVFRLVVIQVIRARDYQAMGRKQYEYSEQIPGIRGNLFDRNGKTLVSNILATSFGADPKMVGDDADEIAATFSRIFGKPRSVYLERLSARNRHFVWLERRVGGQFAKAIQEHAFKGVVEVKEPRRLYHYEHLGAQVVGSTDIDNRGLTGIELRLDSYLRGKDGYVVFQRDGLGGIRPSADFPRVDPTVGSSATLTIDIEYQAIAEEELAHGIERSNAESGLVIMLDPATGEVLAMANYPPISPGDLSTASPSAIRNRAITDIFEPGSVFKVVTASAALDRDIVKPDQKFYAEQGVYKPRLANGTTRKPITDTHPYGMLTFQQAMELSSNIVMAKISDRIGSELLFQTARNFGFGVETGIDLPGEINGDLKLPNTWSGTTLNSMAYGYEVGATPIQIVSAYAGIANRGMMMKPFIVKKVEDASGSVQLENNAQQVRKVASQATARQLTQFFQGVVQRGTGKLAQVPGLGIAGKTGTSRKFIDGEYETGNYTASFVGYFPADDPRVVCLVMLDNPRAGGYTGGEVSAPIFKNIATRVYAMSSRFLRGPGTVVTASANGCVVPDVVGLALDAADDMLRSRGFKVEIAGAGGIVQSQVPRANAIVARGAVVKLSPVSRSVTASGYARIPDVRGMPIRRAINTLSACQLDFIVNGTGVVTAQNPAPGKEVKPGTKIVIHCESRSRSLLSLN
jgi:cell division protein FtsI (penicillin-binding protein 3)